MIHYATLLLVTMLHATLLPEIERRSICATMLHATKLLQIRMTHYAILFLATKLPSVSWPFRGVGHGHGAQ